MVKVTVNDLLGQTLSLRSLYCQATATMAKPQFTFRVACKAPLDSSVGLGRNI